MADAKVAPEASSDVLLIDGSTQIPRGKTALSKPRDEKHTDLHHVQGAMVLIVVSTLVLRFHHLLLRFHHCLFPEALAFHFQNCFVAALQKNLYTLAADGILNRATSL
jgi:hypothetical protein